MQLTPFQLCVVFALVIIVGGGFAMHTYNGTLKASRSSPAISEVGKP